MKRLVILFYTIFLFFIRCPHLEPYYMYDRHILRVKSGIADEKKSKIYYHFLMSSFPKYKETETELCGEKKLLWISSPRELKLLCILNLGIICVDHLTYYCGEQK
jgi:hypothetical protein